MRRPLPNVAAQEIDNALMDLAIISKAAVKLAKANTKEDILSNTLEIVVHAQAAERALRNAKAPKPE